MSALLVSELSLEEAFDRFCALLATLVEVSSVTVAVRDGESWIRLRYERGRSTRRANAVLPYQDPNVPTLAFGRTLLQARPARFSMPLAIGDENVGGVMIRSDAVDAYDEGDATVVQSLAPYLAVTIRQRVLLNAVEHERFRAQHDPLTHAANRALFFERADAAIAHSRRASEGIAVLYLDLDGFKNINDVHGHEAGDAVLRAVARRLHRAVRDTDTIARLGGDEFAVLLEHVRTAAGAAHVARKIVGAVERPIGWNGMRLRVGASIGFALAPADGTDAKALLQRADARMYERKHARKHHAV